MNDKKTMPSEIFKRFVNYISSNRGHKHLLSRRRKMMKRGK